MKKDIRHLAEWGKNKSLFLNFAAQHTVSLVDPLFDVLRVMRGGHTTPQARAYAAKLVVFPGNDLWAEYYHDQRKLFWDFLRAVLSGMGYGEDEIGDVLSLIFSMFHEREFTGEDLQIVTPSEMEEGYKQVVGIFNPLLQAMSKSLKRQIAGEPELKPHGGFMAFMRCPAVKFMVRVFMLCATSYQTTPGILLQKAVDGDEIALGRLLTIDKHALFIPEVAAIYNDRMATDFKRGQNTIAKYLSKSPPVVTKRNLKQGLGMLLNVLMGDIEKHLRGLDKTELALKARKLNKLRLPDIQGLFTAFARDSGAIADHETDSDVDDADAFRQAVHRMRKDLPPLPGQ